MKGRGVAGTHDIQLGVDALDKMINGKGEIKVPVYNKAAYNGLGGRWKESDWLTIQGPLDLVIFEGWMLGYSPVGPDNEVIASNPGMETVNESLKHYSAWDEKLDAAIIAGVESSRIVY